MDTTNELRKMLPYLPSHADEALLHPAVSAKGVVTRLLRIAELTRTVGVCKASVYNLMRSDNFPKPIKIGSASLWIEAEVQAWIANKVEVQRRAA